MIYEGERYYYMLLNLKKSAAQFSSAFDERPIIKDLRLNYISISRVSNKSVKMEGTLMLC